MTRGCGDSALELLLPTLPTYGDQWQSADPTALLDLVRPKRVAA